MNAFILDGTINSRTDLGLRITQVPVIPTSERVIESIEVDGREGDLTLLKGWNDMTFNLKSVIWAKDVWTVWRTITPQILNAKTISFSNDPSVFYKMKTVQASGLTQVLSTMWEFELEITSSPFHYKADVPLINRTSSGTVTNSGNVYSLPRIKVFGSGTRTLTINGKPIILNLQSEYLMIDSELKECFYGDVVANNLMTGDFPEFRVGSNTVTLGTGINKIEIEPRWRYL
ncbi:phage tail protein [Streptococcus thermophilus]|nr:phage tail protein [Streptococcus thermophilus]MCE2209402.1 phage tail protein [Streptococcus thermophilus]